jgi:hypothetical protein
MWHSSRPDNKCANELCTNHRGKLGRWCKACGRVYANGYLKGYSKLYAKVVKLEEKLHEMDMKVMAYEGN